MGGMYLSAEEMAMLTSAPAVSSVGSFAGGFSAMTAVLGDIGSFGNTANAVNTLTSLKPIVKDYLGQKLMLAQGIQSLEGKPIPDFIENYLNDDMQQIIELMKGGLWQGVGGLHATMYETLRGTSNLLGSYNGIIQKIGIDPKIVRWANEKYRPNIPDANLAWKLYMTGMIGGTDYFKYMRQLGWNDNLTGLITEALSPNADPMLLLESYRRGTYSEGAIRTFMRRAGWNKGWQDFFFNLAWVLPEPYRLADMCAKNLTTYEAKKQEWQGSGWDEDNARLLIESQVQRPSIGTLADLYWRELITKEEATINLAKTGYTGDMANTIFSSFEQIPNSQDLITMVVREAFEDANIVQAPTEFASWIKKRGFNKYWADKYWTAHYTPIAVQYAYDNVRRGYRDETWFKDVLRIADIHPRWHQDIINVMYNPPAVRELGYGYDTGVYSRDDIIKYRRWGGLSLEDATKAADALIDYRLEAERNSVRTAYLYQYVDGAISKEGFINNLKVLRTNELAILLWVERGDALIRNNEHKKALAEPKRISVNDALYLVLHGIQDGAWLRKKLLEMGYSEQEQAYYQEISSEQRAEKAAKDEKAFPKKFTVTQLADLFQNKLITEENVKRRLVEMDYNYPDAQLLIDTWKIVAPTKNKELTLAQLAELYTIGALSRDKLKERIVTMGYIATDADSIITLIDNSNNKPTTATKITEADIEDLYTFGYFDIQGLIQEYTNRGFSSRDAQLKAYLATTSTYLPMIKAQYKNAWINETDLAQVITELIQPFNTLGNTEQIVNNMMMAIVKNTAADRTAPERDLTKAEILKGAKNQILTTTEATELLIGLGYSEAEAQYLLVLNGIIAVGDPKGYYHARQAIEARKKSLGLKSVQVPDELIKLEADYKASNKKVTELKGIAGKEVELGKELVNSANIKAQIDTISARFQIKRR